MYTKSLLFLLLVFLSSCSIAPFSNNPSGRSYGAGKTHFSIGNIAANYYMRFGAGISQDIDVGYNIEFGDFATSNFYLRYSILNQDSGPAWGVEYGFGGTDKSEFWFLGTTLSLNFDKMFEFYINTRINRLLIDPDEFSVGDSVAGTKFLSDDLYYLYMSAGMSVHLNEIASLNLYIIKLEGEDIESSGSPFGASVNINF